MGLIDYFRLPKRQWYWYRNENLHIPPPAWPSNGIPAALELTSDKTTLKSVDGTDDAQLIITIVDKDGNAINSCPPVTLTVESGPGEFPTGLSITFTPDSDIAIRDGVAAAEFSFLLRRQNGVIRATSPGRRWAVEITSPTHRNLSPKNAVRETTSVCALHRRECERFDSHFGVAKSDEREQRSAGPQRAPGERWQSYDVLAGCYWGHERMAACGFRTHLDAQRGETDFSVGGKPALQD